MRSGEERRRLEVQLLEEVELLKNKFFALIFYLRAQPALICVLFYFQRKPLPQAALRLAFSPPRHGEGQAYCPFGR